MSIKTTFSRSFFCLSLVLLISISAAAQVSEREKREKEAEQKQQLERKTYALVEEIAGGALSLKLPENRSFVLASSADLLWEHDEPRARNLFWDALNTLNLMNSPIGNDPVSQGVRDAKPSAKEQEQNLTQYFAIFGLRQELLYRVARRDPQLALDMLRSSRQVPAEPPAEWARRGYVLPDDRQLEEQIATEGAARNPERALQLARESLAKGLSYQLFEFMYKLNLKDAELGTKFAGEIIDKLTTRNISADAMGSHIATSLLTLSRPQPTEQLATASGIRPLKLEQEQRRELVELITNAALTETANSNLLYALSAIMPEIREFAPERVAPLQKKLAAFTQTLNKEQRLWSDFNTLRNSGTPEDILKFASRTGDQQNEMEQLAIALAVNRRRADSLRDFVNTEIDDESRRKSLLDGLDTAQINFATTKGETEELQKLVPSIRRKEERARAMSEIAIALEKKGDHGEALSMLDQAQTLIKTDFTSETQTNALLALVGAYALVEPAKAFGIVERTVDRANDDMTKALLLDKIVRSGMVKKGEIRMQNSGIMPIDFAVFKYGKSVAALAKVDFDRTRAAADRFERNELRLMARLLLTQALLSHEDQATQNYAQ